MDAERKLPRRLCFSLLRRNLLRGRFSRWTVDWGSSQAWSSLRHFAGESARATSCLRSTHTPRRLGLGRGGINHLLDFGDTGCRKPTLLKVLADHLRVGRNVEKANLVLGNVAGILREFAIAEGSRYIGANEEIERQFFCFPGFGSVFSETYILALALRSGVHFGDARRRCHHGGGQRHQTQIANP